MRFKDFETAACVACQGDAKIRPPDIDGNRHITLGRKTVCRQIRGQHHQGRRLPGKSARHFLHKCADEGTKIDNIRVHVAHIKKLLCFS
jgi:hypothetical protein